MTLPDVPFPARSPADIAAIQKARLPIALERAKASKLYKGRLDAIDPRRLDDPEVWCRVPILTKEELRLIAPEDFHDVFCIGSPRSIVEYWRSGGATGRPLFYPRSAEDLRYAMEGFRRLIQSPGLTPGDMMHVSFPLGIHPVGHMYARAAEELGVGTVWCGAGSNTPSELQIELIRTLKPTVWAGMASYGLQLAQVAERVGFDLAGSSVKKFLTAAEPVSPGKRARIERLWGAELYDQFGCTEGSAMGSESAAHDGMHFWTDLFHVEVVEEGNGRPVGVGENGRLVMTPLWNNTVTPFLRWDTGDYVTYKGYASSGRLAVYPVIAHAARTAGFFKVRGVNINQAEIEDLMHRTPAVADFKIEAIETLTLDGLRVSIELSRGADPEAARRDLGAAIKRTFELSPEIVFLAAGTVEKELMTQVKPNRFIDRRGNT